MRKGLLSVLVGFILLACGDGNVVIPEDPQIQFEKDSIEMIEYLLMNDYSEDEIGNTTNGIRYVILDSGSMTSIDESDFVEFNYIGKTLGDTIFDTSIQEIGDSLKAHYEENPFVLDNDTIEVFQFTSYDPLFITYSSSGWTIPTGQGGYIPGFAEGMAATFKYLKVGGRVLILIPSGRAYGRNGSGVFIGPNTPIAFELRPIKVTKQ
ncbi:FKBP-type peptidyl-prolyl cis-trans isomerase [Ekhidna sp.]|uniref:FKBP-type peptidyl-prolyl cis-trans isomerase n=1 Tax=Ekhidna sp. TaxID=2608089 RepID=UPI003B5BA8E7